MLEGLMQNTKDFFSRFLVRKNTATPENFCCLSISSQSLSLAQISRKDHKAELILSESVPCNENQFYEPLAQLVKKHQLDGMPCSWLLRPEEYQLLFLEELPVQPSEFQAAIRWSIKDMLQVPMENAVIDGFPVVMQKTANAKKMMMVVVALFSHLKKISDHILLTGLDLKVIDITELALRNIAALYEREEKCAVLIYTHGNAVRLIATQEKQLCFTRHIYDDVSATSQASYDSIALEVQRSLDYYQSQWRRPVPTQIIYATNSIDAVRELSNRLDINVRQCNVDDVLFVPDKMDLDQQIKCLPVIGGALREEGVENAAAS